MVDLGFLLITVFIFTTLLSRSKALAIRLPKDVPDKQKMNQPASGALTVLLAGNDKALYYEGDDPRTMQGTPFVGIRSIILTKKQKQTPQILWSLRSLGLNRL